MFYRIAALTAAALILTGVSSRPGRTECPQDLHDLNAIVEGQQGTQSKVTDQIRTMRDTAQKLQDSNDIAGCTRVAQQALDVWRRSGGFDLALSNEVIGRTVTDPDGKPAGKISDLIIDVASGQIAFAVVESSGFLGIGTDSYAVPWRAIAHKPGADPLTISIARPRLETAPRFTRDAWKDIARGEWAEAVFTYFGIEPYWRQAPSTASAAAPIDSTAVLTQVEAVSKEIQRLQSELEQSRQADRDALGQLGTRIDALTQRIEQIDSRHGVEPGTTPNVTTIPAPEQPSGGTESGASPPQRSPPP